MMWSSEITFVFTEQRFHCKISWILGWTLITMPLAFAIIAAHGKVSIPWEHQKNGKLAPFTFSGMIVIL